MRNPKQVLGKPEMVSVLVRMPRETATQLADAATEFQMSRNEYITFWLNRLADVHERGNLGDMLIELLESEQTGMSPYDPEKMMDASKKPKAKGKKS